MASGATPTITEFDKYYADKETGYPFIRVQNLTERGELYLEDLKYINQFTHNVYLKRSQVKEDDLLVKITGVGRMAIASVPPKGFEGNINQHSVVIKTESREVSEYLAAFLNSDIGEKLASRRSTGGTRPALDYPALRSIPIVFDDKIFQVASIARQKLKEKESQAWGLLESINDFVLSSLKITLPKKPTNTVKNRSFTSHWRNVSGHRIDPFYHQPYFAKINDSVRNGEYPWIYLKQSMQGSLIKGYLPKMEEKEGDCKVIQINSINPDGTINIDNLISAKEVFNSQQKLLTDDILVVITGATIGKISYWNYSGDYYLGGDIVKFQVNSEFNPFFVYSYLRCIPAQIEIKRNITGATNGHLSPQDVKHILIPKPPLNVQNKIAQTVKNKTEEAISLIAEAKKDFEASKKQIEKLILS